MKNQKGITLIALVITIIVLLILAGVSIAMLIGDNGILNNASKAQVQTERENAVENINLALQAIKTEVLSQKADNSSYVVATDDNYATLTDEKIVGNNVKSQGYEINNTTDGAITITYTNENLGIKVQGKIEFADNASSGTITGAAPISGDSSYSAGS